MNKSKHAIEGTHKLKRDVIFKGKLTPSEYAEENYTLVPNTNTMFSYEPSTSRYEEFNNSIDYQQNRVMKLEVYDIMMSFGIDPNSSRRMPGYDDAKKWFTYLYENIKTHRSVCELFIEFSYYFTEQHLNLLKRIDSEHRNIIMAELQEYKKNKFKDIPDFL